nr:MAG TPA: hypothetical protein [Caudoviricetes sp.]
MSSTTKASTGRCAPAPRTWETSAESETPWGAPSSSSARSTRAASTQPPGSSRRTARPETPAPPQASSSPSGSASRTPATNGSS